jgi:hypothetical protein
VNGIIIEANFEQDLKDFIKNNIFSLGNKNNIQNLKKEFGINNNTYWDKSIRDILYDYYNFLDRVIFPFPRRVMLTEDILNSNYYLEYKSKINEIKTKFELGESVNKYLSDKHNKNYKHKDMAFHLLGLHHLHLGDELEDGKIDKSKSKPVYLLIIQIDEKNKIVYFLDILNHKDFDTFDYYKFAKILKNNVLINNEYLKELDKKRILTANNLSSEEYSKLVYNGINALIELDDCLLMPRMRTGNVLMYANYYVKQVSINLKYYENKYLNIIGVHNLLQQKNQYHVGIKRYEINISWLSIDLLNGINITFKGFQEEKV